MKYAFIQAHRPVFSVRAMCRGLLIHPSGFYAWLKSPFCKRAKEDKRQTELLKEAWEDSGKVYGYRKLHDDLCDQGETCCPNRVARLARLAGIKAQIDFGSQTSPMLKPPLMHVNMHCRAVYEGFSYLAVVIDLYSRKVVGWAMQSRQPTDLVLQALLMAVWRRKPAGKVLIHSDQGSQFTSIDWAAFLKQHNLEHSMSRRGNCHDNAVAESFLTYSNVNALGGGSIKPEVTQGVTSSTTSNFSTTQNANMLETGCCHPLILNGSKK